MVLDIVCTRIARLPGGAERLGRLSLDGKRPRPCTSVPDNASIQQADAFKGWWEELGAIGVHRFCLRPGRPS